ncbi:MAG: hypothetical protein ACXVZJ_13505 [Terriglobales bacterium]
MADILDCFVPSGLIGPLFESRNVYFPDPSLAPWIHDVVAEVVGFPHSRHDDDCDAMTQALLALLRRHSSVGLFQLGIVEYPGELPQAVQGRLAGVYESVAGGNPMTPEDEDKLLFDPFLHDLLTKDDNERFGGTGCSIGSAAQNDGANMMLGPRRRVS